MKRERLIAERKKKNKTQSELATDLGISEVYVRKLESGTVKPGRETMIRIEQYYNLGSKKLFPDIFFSNDDKKVITNAEEDNSINNQTA